MRILTIAALVFFVALFSAFSNIPEDTEINTTDIRHSLTGLNGELFNLTTETIQYTNLYEEEPTVRNVLYNIGHGIIYGVIVEMNTAVPIAIETAGGRYAATIFKFVILWVVIMLIFSLPKIVTMIIALVFFIREKRKGKTRVWE